MITPGQMQAGGNIMTHVVKNDMDLIGDTWNIVPCDKTPK